VPYIDENGIPQEPRFGVVSLSGRAIKEWAAKLYEVVVEVKNQQKTSEEVTEDSIKHDTKVNNIDPIQVLKVRLAKGEITKEEFEELRKMLES
jgi:uncharacterized membrane protein